MPQSLSKVYVHIIFSTKNRQNLIDDRIENSLYEYLGGICKGLDCNPIKVGGHKNHVHLLCLLSRKVAQMKLLTDKVIDYIQLQQEHHKHISFQDEFIAFLKKYQVEYDERYIWD